MTGGGGGGWRCGVSVAGMDAGMDAREGGGNDNRCSCGNFLPVMSEGLGIHVAESCEEAGVRVWEGQCGRMWMVLEYSCVSLGHEYRKTI